MKLISFLKQYYFYIFAILLFISISIIKFFPNIKAIKMDPGTINPLIDTSINKDSNSNINITSNSSMFIDLSGAVVNPGVYEMPSGSRVSDILKVGGGFSSNASALWVSRNINLSKLLVDTQKIYIPYEWETYGDCSCKIDTLSLNIPNIPKDFSNTSDTEDFSDTSEDVKEGDGESKEDDSSQDTAKVNINTASIESLDSLSGIGPTYAKKISDNRPYNNFEDLVSKSGVPKSTLDKISTSLTY